MAELARENDSGAKSQPLKTEMRNQVSLVNKDTINKVNAIFENDNP